MTGTNGEENGFTKKMLLDELKAVRNRADRLQTNLDNEQQINRSQHEKNQIVEYRLGQVEKKFDEYTQQNSRDMENIKEFITRSGVAKGASWADIAKIAGVVAIILGGVFTAIITTLTNH